MSALFSVLVLAACSGEAADVEPSDFCSDKPCRLALRDDADWAAVSREVSSPCDLAAESKYLVPAGASSPLAQPIVQDVKTHAFHLEFMNAVLGDAFGAVNPDRYRTLVQRRATRQAYGGALYRLVDEAGATVAYGFDVVWDHALPEESPTAAELAQVHAALEAVIDLPQPLVYAPRALADVEHSYLLDESLGVPIVRPRDCRFGTCDQAGKLCLDIPEPLALCAHFLEGRTIQTEHAYRMRLTVPAGQHVLSTDGPSSLVLIDGAEVGPERTAAVIGAGQWRREGATWTYLQALTVQGASIELRWDYLFADGGPTRLIVVDEALFLMNLLGSDTLGERYYVSSCSPELPRYRITAVLAGGERIVLDYRYQPPFAGSGPLYPMRAEVTLGGVIRIVEDPFRLIYAGEHHNWNNQFWILFDEPIVRGEQVIHGVWIDETEFTKTPIPGLDAISPLDADLVGGEPFEVLTYDDVPVP